MRVEQALLKVFVVIGIGSSTSCEAIGLDTSTVLKFAFSLAEPHLKALATNIGLPAELVDGVREIIDGKPVTDVVMDQIRGQVPPAYGQLLDDLRGGKPLKSLVEGEKGERLVKETSSLTAERWEDFSEQANAVEQNIQDLITGVNRQNADQVIGAISFPYWESNEKQEDDAALRAALDEYWATVGEVDPGLSVAVTDLSHMPSEAFFEADEFAGITIDAEFRAYVTKVLGTEKGFVTVGLITTTFSDGTSSDSIPNLFISRKFGASWRIVASYSE
jgi:hypothetical protein